MDNINPQLLAITLDTLRDAPDLLSPDDLKKIWGISKESAYSIFKSKEFPGFVLGNRIRIHKTTFAIWLLKIGFEGEQIKIH